VVACGAREDEHGCHIFLVGMAGLMARMVVGSWRLWRRPQRLHRLPHVCGDWIGWTWSGVPGQHACAMMRPAFPRGLKRDARFLKHGR